MSEMICFPEKARGDDGLAVKDDLAASAELPGMVHQWR